MSEAPRPTRLPPLDDDLNGEFYRRCADGVLHFQRCDDCGVWRHPPRVLCARCGSEAWSWQPSSGRGRIYTWTVTHRALHPAFPDVPYAVAVTELEEGVRLVSRVLDLPPDALAVDLPVEVVLDPEVDGVRLPQVRPLPPGGG